MCGRDLFVCSGYFVGWVRGSGVQLKWMGVLCTSYGIKLYGCGWGGDRSGGRMDGGEHIGCC